MSIDTACSASLVAVHVALQSIQANDSSTSYVAGVHVECAPYSTDQVWAAGMLAPGGRSKTFDASADGYVRGEACNALALSPLDTVSHELKDSVLLAGSAVNQDGKSSVLTAPNGPAQQELLRAALSNAAVDPAAVRGYSMHGTGTPLGDPIEVGAAWAVLGSGRKNADLDFVASKTWVGHGEPAAGITGILFARQTVMLNLALPILHLRTVNPYVTDALKDASNAVRVARQPAVLSQSANSLLGVSAFAFQGTNAHVVVQRQLMNQNRAGSMKIKPRWNRRRHYMLPAAHLLVRQAVSSVNAAPVPLTVSFQADLPIPQLTYLWDHRVLERIIFPGNGLG